VFNRHQAPSDDKRVGWLTIDIFRPCYVIFVALVDRFILVTLLTLMAL
jgi:hypothetical protein